MLQCYPWCVVFPSSNVNNVVSDLAVWPWAWSLSGDAACRILHNVKPNPEGTGIEHGVWPLHCRSHHTVYPMQHHPQKISWLSGIPKMWNLKLKVFASVLSLAPRCFPQCDVSSAVVTYCSCLSLTLQFPHHTISIRNHNTHLRF
jgi:hypothetical protein